MRCARRRHRAHVTRAAGMPAIRSRASSGASRQGFEDGREGYRALLGLAVENRRIFAIGFLAAIGASLLLAPWLGQNFFPSIDAGQIKLHLRAQTGTRIEETARLATQVEKSIRQADSGLRAQERRRQHRPAGQRHQHRLQQLGADRAGRRRHPDFAERRPSSERPVHRDAAGYPAARIPRRDILVPAGRHRQPDPQFRPVGAD